MSGDLYGWKWRKAREGFLVENPLCVMCAPKPVLGAVVDHKIPHRLGAALASGDANKISAAQKLFWDRGNWQTLCKFCHDSKKQRFEKTGKIAGCDVNGRPLDPNHHWNKNEGQTNRSN